MSKIIINLKHLLLTGMFLHLKIGSTRDELLKSLGEPNQSGCDNAILKYGEIEFNFTNDKLFLIYCDYLDELEKQTFFNLDLWFIKNKISYEQTIKCLIKENIEYTVKYNNDSSLIINLTKSSLHFNMDKYRVYYLDAFAVN